MKNLEIIKLLEKAEDSLKTAKYNLKGDFVLASVNRAYYSNFYCMTALLLSKNIYTKTHQGTHSKFSENFTKPNVFSKEISKLIMDSFDLRQEADYDLEANISESDAQILIDNAKEFYELTKKYLATVKD